MYRRWQWPELATVVIEVQDIQKILKSDWNLDLSAFRSGGSEADFGVSILISHPYQMALTVWSVQIRRALHDVL